MKAFGDAVATRGMVSIATVIEHVVFETGLTLPDVLGPCRKRRLCEARYAIAWLARRHTGKTMVQIGRAMRRDHSTVRHEIGRAQMLRLTDCDFRRQTDHIDSLLVEAAKAWPELAMQLVAA